jgi:hypothetical protein
MIFSTNQVRHLYVANALKSSGNVLNSDAAGTIAVKTDSDKKNLYFSYRGADNLMRSDLIPISSITSAKATNAEAMEYTRKTLIVTLDSNVNDGNIIPGEDYILNISFTQFLGMSDEDTYVKYGMVHGYKGMTASDFYKTLALSLAKNFSREPAALLEFYLDDGGDVTQVTAETKAKDLTGTYTGVVLLEAEQEWVLGTKPQVPVYFAATPIAIKADGDDVAWAKVEDGDSIFTIKNGKKIADLEYFYLGERGDIYRNIGWPNVIPTKYLVDPSKAYDTIDIHYSYSDEGVHVHKSEKDITIVVPQKAEGDYTDVNAIITAINTATGLSIATLK